MGEIWIGSKQQKNILRSKFDGRCAYCGNILDKMHADHMHPVIRVQTDPWGRRLPSSEQRMMRPERNTMDNMMPSCGPCNLHKGGYSLEEWRSLLERSPEVLARDKSIFRAAQRFGIISVSNTPVVFFFERSLAETRSEAPMTDALTRLVESVEAGTIHRSDLDAFIPAFGLSSEANNALDAYKGSLDAAKALHDAVLPGWGVTSLCQLWDVTPSGEYIGIGNDWSIELHHSNGDIQSHEACATASGPSRAWLLAIIRALAHVQG